MSLRLRHALGAEVSRCPSERDVTESGEELEKVVKTAVKWLHPALYAASPRAEAVATIGLASSCHVSPFASSTTHFSHFLL